ncbi:MAG: hypothetical protein F6J87_18230 [Spirulina sp. SIO3F2]|nr:hypothetical protein [Spirulina sp. SIO3F2]
MEAKSAKDGDVLRIESKYACFNQTTITIEELKQKIWQTAFGSVENRKSLITDEGLPCEYLPANEKGWRKARYRISVEIIEEE